MEQVELKRYETMHILGTGADYEVRAAIDRDTGQQVVLKRPTPETVRHHLHESVETRTERMLQAHQKVGHTLPMVARILGYTERANHDAYFGETLGQTYRVMIEERAVGIPLMSDFKARFTGVPIGVGQNLFALFPLMPAPTVPAFAIHRQLLDLEEAFVQAGYLLLDLRPHNVFYQPASGQITVVDCGALIDDTLLAKNAAERRPKAMPTIHDFYLEMLKFYTTPQAPPVDASGYKEPHGVRPVVNLEQELQQLTRQFQRVQVEAVREAALRLIDCIRRRAYATFAEFRQDFMAYLEAVRSAHASLPNLQEVQQVWNEALNWLRAEHWQRYLFQPDTDLATLQY
ncbi:MAG: hypothetical protein AB7N91_23435 [Candidatus Tectimicrobiota bacterium]